MKFLIKKLSFPDLAKLSFFLIISFGALLIMLITPGLLPSALTSVLLYFILAPLINYMERQGLPRTGAIIGLFVACGMALVLATSWLIPSITGEIEAFRHGSVKFGIELKTKLHQYELFITGKSPLLAGLNISEKASKWVEGSVSTLLEILPQIASHLFMILFLVPFMTFILLKDAHDMRRSLLALVPNRYFEVIYSVMSKILDGMGGFVAARIFEALLIMGIVTIPCLILGIPYAFLLGFFVGATNAIPYLGPLLGAIPGVLLALLDPTMPNQLLYVSLIYLSANVVDMVLIFPLVVAKIVNLHPLIVIISVILGSQLFGILGMIIAVPLTSIFKILMGEIYMRVYPENDESFS